MNRSEHVEQAAVIRWAESMEPEYPELALLYAIPNAAKRSPQLAKYMKDEGLKAGVPDICLPVARSGYNSLYIEMKRVGGPNPTKNQIKWLVGLITHGNAAFCCKGANAAITVIEFYIKDKLDMVHYEKPKNVRASWLMA